MRNKAKYQLAMSLLLCLLLIFTDFQQVLAAPEATKEAVESGEEDEETAQDMEEGREVITIDTVDDLLLLSDKCKRGVGTADLDVCLRADIELTDAVSFDGFQSFSGHFHGNGYHITGYKVGHVNAAIGFFGFLEKNALVDNLNLEVTVSSDDSGDYIGGIAGVNSGVIRSCTVEGIMAGTGLVGGIVGLNGSDGRIEECENRAYISSLTGVGGIAGNNRGYIQNSKNTGMVNAGNEWLEYKDNAVVAMSVDGIMDYLTSFAEKGSDIGGIAGWSNGTISGCCNDGIVGYLHAGRNVGGIVGRFCGIVKDCTNNGTVYGKQDVGGIAGQFEPHILEQEGESILEAVDALQAAQDQLAADIERTGDIVDGEINKVNTAIQTEPDNIQSEVEKQKEELQNRPDLIQKPDIHSVLSKVSQTELSYNKIVTDLNNKKENVQDAVMEVPNKAVDAFGQMSEQLNSVNSSLAAAQNKITKQTKQLDRDIKAINDQITNLENLANDRADNLKRIADGGNLIEDYSAIAPENEQASRIKNCINQGYVNGDRNVGGIAGALAMEGSDAEDDIAQNTGNIHMTLAVLENCKNAGVLLVKKANGGGIVGNSDLGLIRNCMDTGYLEAQEANFIGGIAGSAKGTITGCNALTVIRANRYVGGIAGKGRNVTNCYAMPELIGVNGWSGAILGDMLSDRAEEDYSIIHNQMFNSVYDNYYVSDTLFGINGISYDGIAQGLDYETLLEQEDINADFSNLFVVFLNQEYDVIGRSNVTFGDDLSELSYPEIETEEEEYLQWDGFYSKTVIGNTFLQVSSKANLTTLESEWMIDGKPVALVSGLFTEISEFCFEETTERYLPSEQDQTTSHVYTVSLKNAGVTEETMTKLRILNTRPGEKINVYRMEGTEWAPVKTKTIGNYLEIEFLGEDACICVRFTPVDNRVYLYAIGGLGGVILLVVIVICIASGRSKRRKKNTLPAVVE